MGGAVRTITDGVNRTFPVLRPLRLLSLRVTHALLHLQRRGVVGSRAPDRAYQSPIGTSRDLIHVLYLFVGVYCCLLAYNARMELQIVSLAVGVLALIVAGNVWVMSGAKVNRSDVRDHFDGLTVSSLEGVNARIDRLATDWADHREKLNALANRIERRSDRLEKAEQRASTTEAPEEIPWQKPPHMSGDGTPDPLSLRQDILRKAKKGA